MTFNTEPYQGRNAPLVRVSNSEIQTFKECRRKWWLQNYRGLAKKETSLVGPLPLGTRVHNALEVFYTTGEHPVDVYMELLNDDLLVFAGTKEALNEDKQKKFNDEAELGRLMLEGYIEWLEETNADADIEVVAAETILSTRLPGFDNRVELQGKLDLKVRTRFDGAIMSLDHKTAASFDVYYKTSHMSEQLMTYTMLERLQPRTELEPIDGGIYNLLKKVKRAGTAKPPFYERITVRFNDATIRSFWVRTLGTLRDMMSVRQQLDDGADHRYVAYPTPTKDCTWKCPFFAACPMFDDGSSVESLLEASYEQIDPYERYQEPTSE